MSEHHFLREFTKKCIERTTDIRLHAKPAFQHILRFFLSVSNIFFLAFYHFHCSKEEETIFENIDRFAFLMHLYVMLVLGIDEILTSDIYQIKPDFLQTFSKNINDPTRLTFQLLCQIKNNAILPFHKPGYHFKLIFWKKIFIKISKNISFLLKLNKFYGSAGQYYFQIFCCICIESNILQTNDKNFNSNDSL